ncbi:hypothetical protein SASPL_108282 [Salvia splendens]|uniref:Uncharacterized protein n=1 Tax=Salvia splendens TaxID=180675 RepID=A0A8X8YHV0_SALSN|nr:hypothetical protein SASPL_108282 [Salvia splendens]
MFGPRLLQDTSNGAPFDNRQSGKSPSSVFSLFNLKEKSRFWSESVMRTGFDDLESSNPSKLDPTNFTKAGNIANYLKLFEVDSVYLPMPVNFVFIGFEGNGNQERGELHGSDTDTGDNGGQLTVEESVGIGERQHLGVLTAG